jgi:hypothetical protein
MSSRAIEAATYSDVAVRYICGNTAHLDHTLICQFRRENREGFQELFTKVLVMVQEMGNISVDGTKIHANAGKHSAVSYKRSLGEAGEEVAELIKKAEEADSRSLEEGRKAAHAGAKREREEEAPEAEKGVTVKAEMGRRLKTAEGKKIYRKQKETGEPVFGIIKQALGFRQFLLRGLEKVNQEWELVCPGYNLKRLFCLSHG